MPRGVLLVLGDSFNSPVDFARGDRFFFRETTGKDRDIFSDKAVKYSVVNFANLGPQFVDAIPQEIGPRPSKFASKFTQERHKAEALFGCSLIFIP
jgi:hypothetical protein